MITQRVYKLTIVIITTIAINFLLLSSVSAKEIELSLAEAKAHYTIEVAKQIIWPNEHKMDKFLVAVIGLDDELKIAFEQKKSIQIRNKKFEFDYFDDSNFEANRYSLIFITHKKRALNQKIFNQAKGALIITNNRTTENERMVNLVSLRNQIKITLNRNNLSQRGFEVSVTLLELAGTKKDMSEQLRESNSRFKMLSAQILDKEKALDELNKTLLESNSLFDVTQKKLDEKNEILKKNDLKLNILSKQISSSQSEVQENETELARQKLLIEQKQREMTSKENAIEELQINIQKNQNILNQQLKKVKQQNSTIELRDETIIEQQGWVFLTTIMILIFLIMTYFLLKTNRLRNKSNNELEQLNSQLYELAITDDMTKLFNRRYFLEIAQKELLRQQRHECQSVLLMVDIDNFKSVNDTYGHIVGDVVIRTVARVLKNSMREYDLLGRFGGEEYAMMLVDCNIKLASEIAQRFCDEVAAEKINYQDITTNVTVSIGLSKLDPQDTEVEQGLVRADQALYLAKQAGRNRIMAYLKST